MSISYLGDLNARTANLADFVEDDSVDHVDVLPDDNSADTPMSGMSADTGTNQFGTCLLDLCKQSGLRIINGRFGAESGKYTYLTDRGSSVVDYVLATQNLFNHIEYMKVYDPNILSDHCLISFGLSRVSQVRNENASIEESTSPLQYRYIWSTDRSKCYTRELNSGSFITKLNQIIRSFVECVRPKCDR